ncbi:MAG: hypothetical protein OXO51_05545 [Gemmatimonadota bacterium]|nr:hypothetical protein [Gemmatimonadota bacterium]
MVSDISGAPGGLRGSVTSCRDLDAATVATAITAPIAATIAEYCIDVRGELLDAGNVWSFLLQVNTPLAIGDSCMLDLGFFKQNGYVNLGQVFTGEELSRFIDLYDRDKSESGCFWHPISNHGHQTLNCDPLISSPEIDGLIRHPALIGPIETIFEGPSWLGEACLRHMDPRDSNPEEIWHRDRPHATDKPYRCGYLQMMLYLADVHEGTHCFSISPEPCDGPILDTEEQLAQRQGPPARSGRHGCTVQPVRAARRDGTDHAARAQDRSDLLRPSRRPRAQRLYHDSRPAVEGPSGSGGTRFLRDDDQSYAAVCRGLRLRLDY